MPIRNICCGQFIKKYVIICLNRLRSRISRRLLQERTGRWRSIRRKLKKRRDTRILLMENLDILRENFIVSLLHGDIKEDKALEDGKALKLYLDGPAYRMLLLSVEESAFYRVMQQLSASLIKWHPAAARLAGSNGNIAVLLNCGLEEDEELIRRHLAGAEAEQMWLSKKVE